MKSARNGVLAAIVAAPALAAATLLVQAPASWHGSWSKFHVPLAISVAFTCLDVAAAVLFVLSLKSYKLELRQAFRKIVAAMVLIGLGSTQLPVINGFNWWNSWWVMYGFVGLPFMFSGAILYLGVRKLGRLVGINGWLTSFAYTVPIVVIGSVGAMFLPHAAIEIKKSAFASFAAVDAWCLLFYFISSIIILQISRHIGAHYKTAMAWLFVAMTAVTAIPLAILLEGLLTGDTKTTTPVVLVVTSIAGSLLLGASYVFVRAEEY